MCSWVLINDQQVYNCTQCKASCCNDEVTGTVFLYKQSQLNFYLAGTVFLMSEYLYTFVCNYDMHSMTSLHILFVQTFINMIKYHIHVHTTPFSQRRVLLKISTWILHFTSCKNELWKRQWREFHSFYSVQQNSTSRQFKPLQFISEGNQLSMHIAIV